MPCGWLFTATLWSRAKSGHASYRCDRMASLCDSFGRNIRRWIGRWKWQNPLVLTQEKSSLLLERDRLGADKARKSGLQLTLSGGGEWIRTFSTAARKPAISEASLYDQGRHRHQREPCSFFSAVDV